MYRIIEMRLEGNDATYKLVKCIPDGTHLLSRPSFVYAISCIHFFIKDKKGMFIGNFNQIRREVSQRLRGLHVSKIDQIKKKKFCLKSF